MRRRYCMGGLAFSFLLPPGTVARGASLSRKTIPRSTGPRAFFSASGRFRAASSPDENESTIRFGHLQRRRAADSASEKLALAASSVLMGALFLRLEKGAPMARKILLGVAAL